MSNTRNILLAAAAFTITACLAACGGASHAPATTSHPETAPVPVRGETTDVSGASGETVVQVGSAAITRGQVDAWTAAVLGEDYYEIILEPVPTGLLPSPPGYSTCIAAIKTMTKGAASQTTAELKQSCQQLYEAIKQQAVTRLIDEQTSIAIEAELHITITPTQVTRAFEELKAAQYPKPGELERYLANKRWTNTIELETVKESLLAAELDHSYVTATNKPAFLKHYLATKKKWQAKTTCHTGYIAEGCSQYTPPTPPPPSPNQIIEKIARPAPQPPKAADLECKNTKTGALSCHPLKPIHKPQP